LEPIFLNDNGDTTARVFTDVADADQTIRITDSGGPEDGLIKIDSNGTGGFEEVTFSCPADSLTINALNGNDTIILGVWITFLPRYHQWWWGDDTLIGPGTNTWELGNHTGSTPPVHQRKQRSVTVVSLRSRN
jgi:hypothetical protein